MIKEIKKKREKFGSIITFVPDDLRLENFLSHTSLSAYVIAHRIGASNDKGFGQLVVGHRAVPKLKNVIGHYISQIRGGELVVFIGPDTNLLDNGTKVYDHLDANRIERAFALWLGTREKPSAIILSSALIEHLFHAIPDQLDMNGDWIGFIDGWLKKYIFGGRYFDGNDFVSLVVTELVPAESYIIEQDPVMADAGVAVTAPVFEEPVIEKKKPGRPKTKK